VSALVIQHAELQDGRIADVRIERGRVVEIGNEVSSKGAGRVVDAHGGALLPGLHDHHIHLFALAAARASVACGPPEVTSDEQLHLALMGAQVTSGSIRGVGYHESVAGELNRYRLDSLAPEGVPVRVQHRSGAMWILNSAAIDAYSLSQGPWPEGVERNAAGELTGRIYYQDTWLRGRLGAASIPDLAAVGRELASCGVTALMDATPDKDRSDIAALERAIEEGALPQKVTAMGSAALDTHSGGCVEVGPVKVMLREPALPEFDELVELIRTAHIAKRGVAFHCVTRAELVMACGALREAGPLRGDRIEHASIAPPELVALLSELNVWVVTQPGFVFERGKAYLRDVEQADHPWLYRGRGFLDGGVALGAGTDAPYGAADPWVAIRAAVDRTTREGATLGGAEALTPERALALFTSPISSPGELPASIAPGGEADFCLVDLPWREFREKLCREHVAMTVCRGKVIWDRGTDGNA
jgi:predicted amidohydrolase YtcJ